ncbi:hypothetical protein MKX01_000801 [Papaver californicum]|nr:hypothetical protein MKX01_000801 [Papaver californicum]
MIANEMIRLFLYYFNIPKGATWLKSAIVIILAKQTHDFVFGLGYVMSWNAGVIIGLALVEYGVLFLLLSYLTIVFSYSPVHAAATVNIFSFISGILAIFADLCKLRVGCYFMVQVNCISYILALVVLLKNFKPKSVQALYGALFLLAVGHAVFVSTCTEEFLKAQMKKASRVSNEDDDKRDDIRSTIFMMRAKIVGFVCYNPQRMRMIIPNTFGKQETQKQTSLRSAAPICFAFLMYGIVYSTGETFFQNQAEFTDTSIGSEKVSIMTLQCIAKTSRFFIDHMVYLVMSGRSRTGTLATLIRMGLGMFFTIVTCTIAQYTEVVRLTAIKNQDFLVKVGIDFALFIPQFIALGFVTGLARGGLEVFFQNEYSNWIKIYATTITEVLTGIGALLNTFLVLTLDFVTRKPDGETWFHAMKDPDLGMSRVDLFYHTIAVMCVLNFVPVYALISTCYYRKIRIRTFLLLDGM